MNVQFVELKKNKVLLENLQVTLTVNLFES